MALVLTSRSRCLYNDHQLRDQCVNLSGTVTVEGQLSGTFGLTITGGTFNRSGNGTITGFVAGIQ